MVDAREVKIVGQDYRMAKVFELMDAVAQSKATVLISGESGTGKSLIARAIHQQSGRSGGPFVEVSCGALSETLLESELFGHVQGAFTDARTSRQGKFATAHGGTIFLDEIATASPGLQLKLLRVLQERQFEPVGSDQTTDAEVRVILATNGDLWQEVQAGRFRRDLYYRVNVVNIELPPLRQRQGDIALLATHFLLKFQQENDKTIWGIAEEAMEALRQYAWPGNVRELENCMERAVVLCRTGRITPEDLGEAITQPSACPPVTGDADLLAYHAGQRLEDALAASEKKIIQAALEAHQGNRQQAAAGLGINRTTLYKKMRKLGLLQPRHPVSR